MAEILEFILAFVAMAIYGTEEKPRHPIWRNSVRTIAFAGVLVSIASFLNIFGAFEFPLVIVLIWAICSLLVISAEYYVGSKKVCLAAFIVYPIWLAVVLLIENQ